MDETTLQDRLSDELSELRASAPATMNRQAILRRFRNRLPGLISKIGRDVDTIETESGRELDPSDIDVVVRKMSETKALIRLRFFAETRTWMEDLE